MLDIWRTGAGLSCMRDSMVQIWNILESGTGGITGFIITARCTLVQSAVLRSHVVCLSVCLSVRPSVTLVN